MALLSFSRSGAGAPRSLVALWLGILGPPVVWLTQFEVKYALAGGRRTAAHTPALIATSVLSAAVVLLLGHLAGRERQLERSGPPDPAAGVAARNRFMATLGRFSGGLFLLLIVAQLIAECFIPPGGS